MEPTTVEKTTTEVVTSTPKSTSPDVEPTTKPVVVVQTTVKGINFFKISLNIETTSFKY